MALDDFMESEVAAAIAASALLFSPQVRGILRRGAVFGLAGVLAVGEAMVSTARSATAKDGKNANGLEDIVSQPQKPT
jgi:hypothetical protein